MATKIYIDQGHNPENPNAGAEANGVREQDITYAVGQALYDLLENDPNFDARLSRPDPDVVLGTSNTTSLAARVNDANAWGADYFISIHTNAAENRNAQGAETFILGTDRMEDNLDVAMRENAVMKLEQDQTVYQGFDPNSIESYIIFELMQNQYMDNSLVFAELVQNQFVGTLNRANRGVRQAAFWVLLKSACPSVLVEMGFLSNAEEEKWLASEDGKNGIVNGIFSAFEKYYKK